MLGYVRTANINPTHTNTDLHDVTQAYFVQDDWKTTSRLTINLGLRYDYFAPYTQSDDRFVDVYQNGFYSPTSSLHKTPPYGRGLLQPNRKDFGPRFGFAYRPPMGGDWVLRGGYGIYWTTEILTAIFAMAEEPRQLRARPSPVRPAASPISSLTIRLRVPPPLLRARCPSPLATIRI